MRVLQYKLQILRATVTGTLLNMMPNEQAKVVTARETKTLSGVWYNCKIDYEDERVNRLRTARGTKGKKNICP
jgi:hypothetical protein